ncbi:hypothetical protein [Chryseobacterium sp. AG844]|nr:hypothetical protein [Chryseobacterium sp. AG844]
MEPVLNTGEYAFCTVETLAAIPDLEKVLFFSGKMKPLPLW